MTDAHPPETVERTTGSNITASVIWLHGLGADGNDFAPLVDELTMTGPAGLRFVFPHAPIQPVTVNGGMQMRAWYDIRGLGDGIEEDPSGLDQANAIVEALLQREHERGIPDERMILAGFSQGAATALYASLHTQRAIAGIIALSGWLPKTALAAPATTPPVFMAHGTQDPVVPIQLGRNSAQRLSDIGFPVSWQEYPMDHAVCMPEIQALDGWLSQRLG